MHSLPPFLRKQLETSVLAGRRAGEAASRDAIGSLAVFTDRRPEYLDAAQAALRNGLRAKWRQLGNERDLLVAECAYEQWHRLLFARFLAENNLLLHPHFHAPVSLAECEELADDLGEPDAWSVAARFAAEILPGIFRIDDPCVRLRLAPEGRQGLEQILEAIPAETFVADDALGWVYQFWQKDKKDEVNASERKIGGADLGPVTQLFTENYMVRFLLENSLGAWWAVRHPDSPLVKGFDYLRFHDDGKPAAGSFDGWPDRVAEVTVMDPCCGSGHFLVEAFGMLWQMRSEEEGVSPVEAQDAVLRDNLFGLEIDPRCVQIAMFNVALQAWKVGGGWRHLPVPNIACSGIPVKAPVEEWKALAGGDERIENAVVRLHTLFRDADTLGSLIDPKRATEGPTGHQISLDDVEWETVGPLLADAIGREESDQATAVLGADAAGLAQSAELLSKSYVLVATNVPFLERGNQSAVLSTFASQRYPSASPELATTFVERAVDMLINAGCCAVVSPQSWLFLGTYMTFRANLMDRADLRVLAWLASKAFRSISGEVVQPVLMVLSKGRQKDLSRIIGLDASRASTIEEKAELLRTGEMHLSDQSEQRANPDGRILIDPLHSGELMSDYAYSYVGVQTSDYARFGRNFWELDHLGFVWIPQQSTVKQTIPYGGREWALRWEGGSGELERYAQEAVLTLKRAHRRGLDAWGKHGVAVSQMGELCGSLYTGEAFDTNAAVVIPHNPDDLGAIWAYVESGEHAAAVRLIDQSIKVTNATLVKVPFDVQRWREVADQSGPLPEPWSDDPTQWLFTGRPERSTAPLQVAVVRLLGYRWPDQPETDDLDAFVDTDGIVCLPSVLGEATATDRLQQLLATAFGESWTPSRAKNLLDLAGSKKNLADWLRDEFFKQHCSLFGNRPFVWHIWDGQREGFSALVNYHRLDRKTLEKLTYSYLGQDWVERQRAEVRDDVAGADARLAAALELQKTLEAILEGEAPLDIYVRWKELHEQPIGWEPDLNDGVRLNIRPFVEADVLRGPFNIHWRKDRGKNPDGTERLNDIHPTQVEKLDARRNVGRL